MALTLADLASLGPQGFKLSDFPTFLQWVQEGYKGIYGNDVYLGADSMDGQWTTFLAQALKDTGSLAQTTYNSFAPPGAQGVALARLVKINGLLKRSPTNSTVILTIIGTAGTIITNGVAVDSLSQKWNLPSPITIPFGGSITVTATAADVGAIQAAANTVTGIFTPTNGWQSVNNAAQATPGAPVETDAQLRARQIKSTANPSLTVLEGTFGAVANVPGVENTAVWENFTDTTDGNTQPPHSILVVAQGGAIVPIAQAIQIHKTPGTNPWQGPTFAGHNQSQVVYDSRGMPITIKFFQPPNTATIGIQVTLTPGPGWTTDFQTVIAAQMAAYINALGIGAGDQFAGFARVIPLYTLAYVPNYLPSMYIVNSIQIQKNADGFSTVDRPITFVELPVTSPTPGVDIIFP